MSHDMVGVAAMVRFYIKVTCSFEELTINT
jgi:hypothetical protein